MFITSSSTLSGGLGRSPELSLSPPSASAPMTDTPASPVPSPTWVDSIASSRPILGRDVGMPRLTFNAAYKEAVARNPDRVQYTDHTGRPHTLSQFNELSVSVAKAMLHLHVAPLHGVAIHALNSVNWFAVDVAASLAAAIPVGIYTTNKPDIVSYILNHAQCRLLFVDDAPALTKALSVKHNCPSLVHIITWDPHYQPADFSADHPDISDLVLTWHDFLALADHVSDDHLDQRSHIPTPDSVCKLIYTSGTTGPPKAVMISHDNIVFTAKHFGGYMGAGPGDRLISYLPASHVAANMVDIVGAILNGISVHFADADALKGSLGATMKKVRPTIFCAVPRVLEKIHEGLLKAGASNGPVKRALATWAKQIGTAASTARDNGDDLMPWGYSLAKLLVFNNVRYALGLDETRILINTSAPLQPSTDAYFKSLDMRILDLYGMSEATGPISLNFPEYRKGTSGKAIPCMDVKLDKAREGDEEGELCVRGRNMFMGYLDNAEESEKVMDEEGYVHTGDLARVDSEDFITITGRVKDLLVTAGGENVAPYLVEATLISAMPAVSRAFAIGDGRRFISALLIPCMDESGRLTGPARLVNENVENGAEAMKDEKWREYVKKGVELANEDAISNAAKVKQWRMLGQDFSVEGEELTPSMKVKRKIVLEKYGEVVEDMYR